MRGSSPRVRGEASARRMESRIRGIIPAGAGRRQYQTIIPEEERDHPRGCGEKSSAVTSLCRPEGSSPRVRGEEASMMILAPGEGIIPAGAGRRYSFQRWLRAHWDHPRGCGEKRCGVKGQFAVEGSSPRVRGEVLERSYFHTVSGIIPAGAGRRLQPRAPVGARGDHPRGCGEKALIQSLHALIEGSSPRVRGEDKNAFPKERRVGIIPAGAGRSILPSIPNLRERDHPRGCGEKFTFSGLVSAVSGSSPRVRGEANVGLGGQRDEGIIPAGAGRRMELAIVRPPFGDHPRGCGEKSGCGVWSGRSVGSSPRVRGEASALLWQFHLLGIIPAGAGRSFLHARGYGGLQDHPRGCGEKATLSRW